MDDRARPFHDLAARVRTLGFARTTLEHFATITPVALDPAAPAPAEPRVDWAAPRPLELLHPLPGLTVARPQIGAAAQAIVDLNRRLPVPGFGLDARDRVVWCSVLRRQPGGVSLSTLRAHVDLAVDMVALGVRHFGALLGATLARRAGGER